MQTIAIDPIISTIELREMLENISDEYVLIVNKRKEVTILPDAIKRLLQIAEDSGVAWIYGDYVEELPDGSMEFHPTCDYLPGSFRDDFDFGGVVLARTQLVRNALWICPHYQYAAFYAARLIISADERVFHLPEVLSRVSERPRTEGEEQFDYVDPRNRGVQLEMELAFTAYLRMVGAFLPPRTRLVDIEAGDFANEVSVIIPVRNRVRTISDAVHSALEQKLDKPFNVIVVDNHSTDGTSEVLSRLAAEDPRLIVITPERQDLGIGGCWCRAVEHPECGRYSVQLDSDDRYKTDQTLQKIVDCFRRERCAMVVGSYELTDFDGNPIPPGLIDHSEWTQGNGHNNALRINGFGAPRAFFTPVIREVGVPNVSYGEDYAVGIRITRLYKMARIYESLYLCRRWEGNTDHRLSPRTIVEHNNYKDWLRTIALMARKKMNRS